MRIDFWQGGSEIWRWMQGYEYLNISRCSLEPKFVPRGVSIGPDASCEMIGHSLKPGIVSHQVRGVLVGEEPHPIRTHSYKVAGTAPASAAHFFVSIFLLLVEDLNIDRMMHIARQELGADLCPHNFCLAFPVHYILLEQHARGTSTRAQCPGHSARRHC